MIDRRDFIKSCFAAALIPKLGVLGNAQPEPNKFQPFLDHMKVCRQCWEGHRGPYLLCSIGGELLTPKGDLGRLD